MTEPLLGVEGTIENESPVDLVAENLALKAELARAAQIISDQQTLLTQIKQEIENGNLTPTPGNRAITDRPG